MAEKVPEKKPDKEQLFLYRGIQYPGIEIHIGERTFRFRTEFVINDAIEIGVPLIDIQKYRDPITGTTDLKKIEGEDLKIMQRWIRDLLTQLSIDHFDFGKSHDIAYFYAIQQEPAMTKLVTDLMNSFNLPEKKKLTPIP